MLNFDNLSIDAQSVMRRIIEIFINTRFFIIVENKFKLLNPIISRFCSIYIPEHLNMERSEVINLHKLGTCHIDETDENVKGELDSLFGGGGGGGGSEIVVQPTLEKCENLYENGVSCMDFVKYFDKNEKISFEIKNTLMMNFYVFKREYRCEKLLMYHMWLSFMTSNSSEIISIIE